MEGNPMNNNNIINMILNQSVPRIRIIPHILFTNIIDNDQLTNITNLSFNEQKESVKPICKVFKEGLTKLKVKTDDDISCAICQEQLKEGENVIKLPCEGTSHFFHYDDSECPGIYPWLEVNNTCPICRTSFPMEDVNDEADAEADTDAEVEVEVEDDFYMDINLPMNNNTINSYFERVFTELEEIDLDEAIRRSLEDH